MTATHRPRLTLSNAIRRGIPLVPPTRGLTFRFDASGKDWAARRAHMKTLLGADALGTALCGLAGNTKDAIERAFSYNNGPLGVLYGLYPILIESKKQCPVCSRKATWTNGTPPMVLIGLLRHLTDQHNYTREQIADFLEAK